MIRLDPVSRAGYFTLAVCACALAGSATAADPASQGPAANPPSIAVTGEGEVQLEPDRAQVPIDIESDAASSAAAGADNARRTQSVIAALRRAGAAPADIATAGYTVQPQWVYPPSGPPHRGGYRASMQLQLSVGHLPRLGPWIDAALSGGASGVGDVQFDSSHLQEARQQALTQAVQHAQADAGTLAQAAGGRLGPLLELSTQEPGLQPGLQEVVVSAARPEAPGTRFQTTHLQVRAVVLARWAFVAAPQ